MTAANIPIMWWEVVCGWLSMADQVLGHQMERDEPTPW